MEQIMVNYLYLEHINVYNKKFIFETENLDVLQTNYWFMTLLVLEYKNQ